MSVRVASVLALFMLTACGSDTDPPTAGDTGSTGAEMSTDGSSTVAPESTSADDGSDSTGAAGPVGCDDIPLLANPEDPAEPGPWPVGVRTVMLGELTAEVWYPATPGSEAGADTEQYDIRLALPEREQGKISDEDNPWQPCDCYRDLPIDDAHGPYPAVFFIHGTAGFRTQSLPQMTHWASRGFVVIALDHPGLWLKDLIGSVCGGPSVTQAIPDDIEIAMAAARGDMPGLEDFTPHIDDERFAVSGHSAGGSQTARWGDDAQVLIPMAAGGVDPGSALISTLVLGAVDDSVVPYSAQTDGYDASPAPKRLVGIDNQGHLAFSGLCSLENAAGDDLLTIAVDAGVCGANLAGALFQCDDTFLPDPDAWQIINYATSAVLEETLHCSDIGAQLEDIEAQYSGVAEYRHEPG